MNDRANGQEGRPFESAVHGLEAPDGWRLNVLQVEVARPGGDAAAPKQVVVVGHAMMVDRRTLWRAGRASLVGTLAEHGLTVLVPDLRGHGTSGPRPAEGGKWGYDDLVADTEVYLRLAREMAGRDGRVTLVGHSLFAHVSLAYLGTRGTAGVAGLVALAMSLWRRSLEPSRARWLLKRGVIGLGTALSKWYGFLPVRRFRSGTADESRGYWEGFEQWIAGDCWTSRQGVDYAASLARVDIPVLHVVSEGDRLLARPDDALGFSRSLPQREVWHLGSPQVAAGLDGLRPDHIGMVTDVRNQALWQAVAQWVRRLSPK